MRNPDFDTFWKMFSGSLDEAQRFITFEPQSSSSLIFFQDISDAFQTKDDTVFPSDLDLDPVNEANEFIVGQVTMPVLKALFMLKIRLNKALDMVMEERVSLSAKPSPDELKNVFKKYDSMKEKIDFVGHLFWLGVEKQFPMVAEGNNFALRRDWKIVRISKFVPGLYNLVALEVLHRIQD